MKLLQMQMEAVVPEQAVALPEVLHQEDAFLEICTAPSHIQGRPVGQGDRGREPRWERATRPAVMSYHVSQYCNINNICVSVVYNGPRRPDAPSCAEFRTAQSGPEVRRVPERLLREQPKISQRPPSGNTSSSRRSGRRSEGGSSWNSTSKSQAPPGMGTSSGGKEVVQEGLPDSRGTVYQAGDGSIQEGAEGTPDAEKGLQGGEGMKRGRTSGWRCRRRA